VRVAIVTTSYPARAGDPSGHFVAAHAAHLAALGHRVTVLAPGAPSDEAVPPGGTRIALGASPLFGWPGAVAKARARPRAALEAPGFVLRARRALAAHGPFDVVAAHFLVPCAWPIAAGLAAELEAHAHGADVRLLVALPSWLRARIVASVLAERGRVVFAASHLQDALVGSLPPRLGARLRRASTVGPPFIQVPSLGALPAPSPRPARPYAVWVGRCIPEKRLALAARAVAQSALPLVVVGDGPVPAPPGVLRTGLVSREVALGWIAHAAVLVSTSLEEGAPTAVREARRLGVPVVATPAGDLERWAETDPGIVIVRDEAALVAALRQLERPE
jgi:glycosyltransferase involved in cell wall biosynthesis